MKFISPIEGKKAEDLYKMIREGNGGFYPIGAFNMWHGGVHLEGKHAAVAIADGIIVAYRAQQKYLEEKVGDKTYQYSNSFVVVKHTYKTPNGAELRFFSHYGHLAALDDFDAEQKKKKPVYFKKMGYVVTASELNVRSTKDTSDNKNVIRNIKKDQQVEIESKDDSWAKIKGKDEYISAKYIKEATVEGDPVVDEIIGCEIPVKAGELLGYSGLCEANGVPAKYRLVHVEVFSDDNVDQFLKNPKKDGAKKPTSLKIAEGAILRQQEKKYPSPDTLKTGKLPKWSTLAIVNKSDKEFVQVKTNQIIRGCGSFGF